jgi:hypothetical protein
MTLGQAFARIRGTVKEFEAARFCLIHVQEGIIAGAALRKTDPVQSSDISKCRRNLESTYLLRLFAEFEFVLRSYLAVVRPSPRPRQKRMEHLINRIAAARTIPYDIYADVHQVRVHRNDLVHVLEGLGVLTFYECKSRLGKFLRYLPPKW